MTTIRVATRQRFAVVDQRAVRDDRLSFRARGVLVWLLDKPDCWSTRAESIARAGTEGRDAIITALRELETCGYLVRQKIQSIDGRWSTEVTVYESPCPVEPETDFQESGNQESVFQGLSNRSTEKERLTGDSDSKVVAPDPRVFALVGGYVDDYRAERQGQDPARSFKASCGKAVKNALKDGVSAEDIARCLGVIAHESKNPSTLPYVLADFHAGRERRMK